MLSVATEALRFSSSQNICVKLFPPTLSVMYITDSSLEPAHNTRPELDGRLANRLPGGRAPVARCSLDEFSSEMVGALKGAFMPTTQASATAQTSREVPQ